MLSDEFTVLAGVDIAEALAAPDGDVTVAVTGEDATWHFDRNTSSGCHVVGVSPSVT